ncbi:MAG TPA: response regulator [Deltaproteobacteria bacterium]|nr:response regulator [Deltaproteobacteria bacterium]HIJ76840.1 response regulator [Deltaproteobacteria bacterium]
MRVENLVLLVEDDASLKRSLEKFLDRAGYAFHSCSTASQALALAQKAPPHVVILEYHLPDANGHSLIEKLNLVAPETVAIVLSEYDFQAVADDLHRVKIQTFLKKPFDLVDFEAALCSACAKAIRNQGKGQWRPEVKLEGASASKFARGTLGNRTGQ